MQHELPWHCIIKVQCLPQNYTQVCSVWEGWGKSLNNDLYLYVYKHRKLFWPLHIWEDSEESQIAMGSNQFLKILSIISKNLFQIWHQKHLDNQYISKCPRLKETLQYYNWLYEKQKILYFIYVNFPLKRTKISD